MIAIDSIPMIAIGRERLSPDLIAELRPLIAANHAAIGAPATLDPDWVMLHDLDHGNALCLIVARIDGEPVGYVAHAMQDHQLYDERWAVCVAIYLDPAHRGLARQLLSAACDAAKGGGAAVVTYNVPHLSRTGAFFESQGYECAELVMAKRLEKPDA